jgi:hypothetical protein
MTAQFTQADLTTLFRNLSDVATALNTQATAGQNVNNNASSFSKPDAFKGKNSTEARRFLTHFTSWAAERTDLSANEQKRIKSCLQLMSDTAGNWGSRYLKDMNAGNTPFADWAAFETVFNTRWLSANDKAEALAALETLKQGKRTVAEYSAEFQDLCSRTDLDGTGKIRQFLKGLNQRILDSFTQSEAIITDDALLANTFEKVNTRCLRLDARLNDPALRSLGANTGTRDPMAMDVDATNTGNGNKTRQDYVQALGGKCYGCGNVGHMIKTDLCRAKNVVCRYCKRTGHFEQCCEDKFCGRPRDRGLRQRGRGNQRRGGGQRVNAAFTLFPGEALQTADDAPAIINAAQTAPAAPAAPVAPAAPAITVAQYNALMANVADLRAMVASTQHQDADQEDFP